MSCPCSPPPPLPHLCLLLLLCNWDAEALTELIYCNGELCNVEGNTHYYHTCDHTHRSTRVFVEENVTLRHVWGASSVVLVLGEFVPRCLLWKSHICITVRDWQPEWGCYVVWCQLKKNVKIRRIYLRQNAQKMSLVASLSPAHAALPVPPASGRQRRFILLRQRTSLTHMRTQSQTHTHTQEHQGLLSYTSH